MRAYKEGYESSCCKADKSELMFAYKRSSTCLVLQYIKVRTKVSSQLSTLRREELLLEAYAVDRWKGSR